MRVRRDEGYLVFSTSEAFTDDFPLKSPSLLEGEVFVVLGETGLTLLVHQQNKSDPHLLSFSILLLRLRSLIYSTPIEGRLKKTERSGILYPVRERKGGLPCKTA